MKHWKNLLVCLLAGVLALGVLTACSGLGSVNTGTDAEKAAELARQLGVAYAPELDNTAKAVAEWVCTGTGQPAGQRPGSGVHRGAGCGQQHEPYG